MRNSPRRSKTPAISRIGALLILIAGLWAGGLFSYAGGIPATVTNPNMKTDAIVVLTGGSGRLDEGLKLLEQGLAGKLFISGVYKGVDMQSLLKAYRDSPSNLNCCVAIGYAEDTINNALETAEWVRVNGYTSLRLVTGAYHMPRSVLEFKHALPGALLIEHPVFPAHVKQTNWWAWPGTTGLIVGEYNKFLVAWARHRLLDLL